MAEDHLLLPGATSGVLISRPSYPHWARRLAIALGILAVLIGGADVLTRMSQKVLGCRAASLAFGPAISAIDPSVGGESGAQTPCP